MQKESRVLGSLVMAAERREGKDEKRLVADVIAERGDKLGGDRRRVMGEKSLVRHLKRAESLEEKWVDDDDSEEEGVRGGWVDTPDEEEEGVRGGWVAPPEEAEEEVEEEQVVPEHVPPKAAVSAPQSSDIVPSSPPSPPPLASAAPPPPAPLPVKVKQAPAKEPISAPAVAPPPPPPPAVKEEPYVYMGGVPKGRHVPAVATRDPLTGQERDASVRYSAPKISPYEKEWPQEMGEEPMSLSWADHPKSLTEEDEIADLFGLDRADSGHVLSDTVEDGDGKISGLGVATRSNPMFDGLTLRSNGDAKLPTKLGVAVDRLPGYGEGYAERGSGLPLPGWDGASEASAPVDGHRAVSSSGPLPIPIFLLCLLPFRLSSPCAYLCA